jgi:hypothetical protein
MQNLPSMPEGLVDPEAPTRFLFLHEFHGVVMEDNILFIPVVKPLCSSALLTVVKVQFVIIELSRVFAVL